MVADNTAKALRVRLVVATTGIVAVAVAVVLRKAGRPFVGEQHPLSWEGAVRGAETCPLSRS